MNTKHIRSIVASLCLACLVPLFALAQPVITTQPKNQFVTPGRSISFSVQLSGGGPFSYQWLFDGVAMAGATSGGVLVPNAQPSQSGYYSVIVSNASGSVTSQVALLKVFFTVPHSLSGLQIEPGGFVSLNFKGETTPSLGPYYDLYPLETSSNLVDWAPLVTLQRTNAALDTLRFLDADAPQSRLRFYRTPTNQLVTPDSRPTGPYSVGTFSMLLSRTNTLGQINHQFMVTFWYPSVAQAGVLPAKYVDAQVAADGYYNLTGYGGGNFGGQVASFFSHSGSNAPIATNPAKYPVVLYQPGAGGHRRENTDKAEDLASWGYVVVGLDTSDTDVSVFPNGTVVNGQGIGGTIGTINAAIEGRLLDEQFVLDELESLNANDPRLGGRLDLDNIGAFGWSLGGATAAQLCLRDPRCKAGVGLDGAFFETNVLTQPLNVPWLYFDEGDLVPNPLIIFPDGRPDDRLEVYNKQVTDAFWVKIGSTVHGNFADPGLIVDSASLDAFWGVPISGQFLPSARVSQIVRSYLLSFFNKFLKGKDDHLLDGPSSAFPEVVQFLSKSSASVPPEYPSAGLVQGSDGNFYGTTEYGGAGNSGTVFQMSPAGALTTLVVFNGTNGGYPGAGLVQGSDGNFYGTTSGGGASGHGTVFKTSAAGVLTTLISFNGTNGSYPIAGLVEGSDGNFYGITGDGGAGGAGTAFKMTPAGVLTTLVSFNGGVKGGAPYGTLAQGTNGNFYGTTAGGGTFVGPSGSLAGTVFKMTPGGVLTILVSFNGTDGFAPTGLVEGSDGNFYGTTAYGGNLSFNGAYGLGTVFKMTPAGVLTTLVSFNGANGSFPEATLVQGSDGDLYGTTFGGGAGGGGIVFKMTAAGVLTTLVSFNAANGASPSRLVQGSDGNFYGTTEYGGAGGRGTVFKMTPAGTLTTLVSF